jgi:hypothetical protein
MPVIRRYLFALKGEKWDTGRTPLNGLQNHTMKNFGEVADEALRAMKQRALELNLKGVAIVVGSEGDRVESWSSKMLVVGALKKVPSADDPGMNLLAVAYSKAAEMSDTLQASGGGARPPLKGEFGWPGGVIVRGKTGYLIAAFSGGAGADDVKVSQAGLDILAATL